MTRERRQHLPLQQRIKALAAIAAASAALIVSTDHAYLKARNSQLGQGAAAQLAKLVHSTWVTAPRFKIEVGGEPFARDPRGAAIRSAVLAAAATGGGNDFLILSRSGDEFIQAAHVRGGWELEFRVVRLGGPRSAPVLFECQKLVSRETVVRAFELYRSGNIAWTNVCAWVWAT